MSELQKLIGSLIEDLEKMIDAISLFEIFGRRANKFMLYLARHRLEKDAPDIREDILAFHKKMQSAVILSDIGLECFTKDCNLFMAICTTVIPELDEIMTKQIEAEKEEKSKIILEMHKLSMGNIKEEPVKDIEEDVTKELNEILKERAQRDIEDIINEMLKKPNGVNHDKD